VSYYQRHLPHYQPPDAILFVTWRLAGSLPPGLAMKSSAIQGGRAFVERDRVLDAAAFGPVWLNDSRVGRSVVEAFERGEREYGLYELLAYVVMSNHVHVVIRPFQKLSAITRWVKGSTARSANLILGRTGNSFWQDESYDHCIRNTQELNRVIHYVESNPVAAGLVLSAESWLWSSAGRRPAETPVPGRRSGRQR
jgi:REP element-mobilizing transposase RayT